MKSIRDVEVKNKRVLLRADFNVTMKNGQIVDDNKIKAALPTIEYLIQRKAKLILATHLGKPEGVVNLELSTIPLARRLASLLGRPVSGTDLVVDSKVEEIIKMINSGDILVIGNLRFDRGEEANSDNFARELANLADIYVDDAFAEAHRQVASTCAITRFLPSYAGFLIESEMTTLNLLLSNAGRPFIVIIGGAKVKDKAGVIRALLAKADKVLIGGAVANTFLSARGDDIGKSLYEVNMVSECTDLLEKFKDKIVLPIDGVRRNSEGGMFEILDIGPQTIDLFSHEISEAKTIFWNGNLGYTEEEEYAKGTSKIAQTIIEHEGTKVVAGGDTVAFINSHNLGKGFSFISTGGGAALEFLAGNEMPGIKALG